MFWTRFSDLAVIQSDEGKVYGFHPYRLELAQLDESTLKAIQSFQAGQNSNQVLQNLDELKSWLNETSNSLTGDALPDIKTQVLSLNISQICNLKCTYCAAGGDGTYGSSVKS